jgi:streptogrisin C
MRTGPGRAAGITLALAAIMIAAAVPAGAAPTGPAAAAPAGLAPAGATPAVADPTTLTVADAPGSVAYLRRAYGVSEREALRRLELQRASTGLAQRLSARFPQEYGGVWLDQAGGGTLKVAMTRPELLGAALTGVADAAHIKAVKVSRSARTLRTAADRISARTGVPAVADPVRNTVVVPRGKVTEPGVTVETRPLPAGRQKSCDPRFCARPPLQGGIRLDVTRDNGTFGGCTTGFNLASATGEIYVLTAGHCVDNTNHRNVDRTFHQRLGVNWPVTVENEALSINAFPNDYAIMPFQPGAIDRWTAVGPTGKPTRSWHLVNSWCPGGCPSSRSIGLVGLVEYADILPGSVVCATGSGYTPGPGETYVDSGAGIGYVPGTRCGEITGKTGGGIDVRICARAGDSGGPLFSEVDRKALGILSFGDDGDGACTNPQERNFYVPVSTILAHANAASGLGFRLITAPPVERRPALAGNRVARP